MKKISIFSIVVVALFSILWVSCKKQEQIVAPPLPGNEALTTMVIRAVNVANPVDTITAMWQQLDLTGATPVNLRGDTLRLRPSTTYNVQISILDSNTDLTNDIYRKGEYHILCFETSTNLNLSVARNDQDSNKTPLPIGLKDLFTTGLISNGNLNVTLRHQPNTKDGTCGPGSIDMNCNFYVEVE
jgi:hypothetical protein